MFKFQRFFSGPGAWSDNLFLEEEPIGIIGKDKEGLFVSLKRNLTLSEINLLIAQLSIRNPEIIQETIEFQKYEE